MSTSERPFVGQRVTLCHLLHEGLYPGEVISTDWLLENTCTVKLDCQDAPVHDVLYYEGPPGEICSTRWQACWPEGAPA